MTEIDALAAATSLLVALDFDGTMVPIASRNDSVEVPRKLVATMDRLLGSPGTTVAVFSGRELGDLRNRVPRADECWLSAEHGLVLNPPKAETSPAPAGFPAELEPFVSMPLFPGVRRECKRSSVAFHWRGRSGGEPLGWTASLQARARSCGLEVIEGKMALEILPRGSNSLQNLETVAKACRASSIVFASDDRSDFESIHAAGQGGVGIFVYSGERRWGAPEGCLVMEDPEQLSEWLSELARRRNAACEAPVPGSDSSIRPPDPPS